MDIRFIEQLGRLEKKVESLLKLVNALLSLVKSSNLLDAEGLCKIGINDTELK